MARITCKCGHQTELSEFLENGGLYCIRCGAKLTDPVAEEAVPLDDPGSQTPSPARRPSALRRFMRTSKGSYFRPGSVASAMLKPRVPFSGFAIAGFVLSIACFPLGAIFASIGWYECRSKKLRGEVLAIMGLVISAAWLFIYLSYAAHTADRAR